MILKDLKIENIEIPLYELNICDDFNSYRIIILWVTGSFEWQWGKVSSEGNSTGYLTTWQHTFAHYECQHYE